MKRLGILNASTILPTLAMLFSSPVFAEEKLNWSVTPYIWGTKTQYDLTADGSPVGAGSVSFSDLMDSTDASFQVVVEAGRDKGHWSVLTDITYIDTSDDESIAIPDIGTVRIDSEATQIHADLAVAYWPWSEAGGLSLLAGIRYTDLDDESTFTLTDPVTVQLGQVSTDRDFTDALLGVRHIFTLDERWKVHTRVDYAFGDSEGIFQAQALLRYAVGREEAHGIMLGYRYKNSEFEDGSLEEDYEYTGPLVGFNFRF